MPQRIPIPAWVQKLSAELELKAGAAETSIEAQTLRMAEVRQQGPAVFKVLCEHARYAALALRYKFDASANWFLVKNETIPFRQLQCILDIQQMGIAILYTLGAMSGGKLPKVDKDFIDIRLRPPENFLILVYRGEEVNVSEVLEVVFRRAFVPAA